MNSGLRRGSKDIYARNVAKARNKNIIIFNNKGQSLTKNCPLIHDHQKLYKNPTAITSFICHLALPSVSLISLS